MPQHTHTEAEREDLRDYLNQYALAITEKHRLQRRLLQLRYDMKCLPSRPLREAASKHTAHVCQTGGTMCPWWKRRTG